MLCLLSESLGRRVFLPLAIACLCCSSGASAWIEAVEVNPESPTEADSVEIIVKGYFEDGCWSIDGVLCGELVTSRLEIEIAAHDSWQEGSICPSEWWRYERRCRYPPVGAGLYGVFVLESHESVRHPCPDPAFLEFTVEPETPTVKSSWGRIRQLFR